MVASYVGLVPRQVFFFFFGGGGFRRMNFFGVMKILRIFFWGHPKIGLV